MKVKITSFTELFKERQWHLNCDTALGSIVAKIDTNEERIKRPMNSHQRV